MRRLKGLVGRRKLRDDVVELTVAELVGPDGPLHRPLGKPADLRRLSREVEAVADYVRRLRGEIARLKVDELLRRRLPGLRDDLSAARDATAAGAETVVAAAEAILALPDDTPGAYRAAVEARALAILEACSFQDIAGQRVARALDQLAMTEKRLSRFAKTVKIPDAVDTFDREAIVREIRREVLMVEGPQKAGDAIEQDAIDKLFG